MKYFAYGSNLNRKQMAERCPDAGPLNTAILPNFKLVFVGWTRQWHGAVASIKPARDSKVRGALYEVTEQCQRRLDGYEGYPVAYDRLNITVFDEDDQAIPAFTYIKKDQNQEGAPSKEYLAVIQQGLRDWRLF